MNTDLQNHLFTLAAIFENLEDAVLTHDLNHIILQVNPAAEAALGFKSKELTGAPISNIIPEEFREQHLELFARLQAGEKITNFRTYRVNHAGIVFPVSLTISPVKDTHGNIIGASHIIRDTSADIDAEEKQAVLASIIDTSGDAIISKNLDGIITSWNSGAEQIFGYTANEAIGKSITFLIPRERLDEEDYILSTIKSGKRVEHFQTYRLSKNGNAIPISLTVSPIKDKLGAIIGISKIARNISSEQLAAERQAMLAAIVESSDDAIVSKNLDGIILSWNKGAEKIFGYTEDEAIGKHISILIPENRLYEETDIISRIKKGEKIDHFQTTRITKTGKELDISLTVSPITDAQGKVIGASKVARDITMQKNAETALKRNNFKLAILNDLGKELSRDLDTHSILQKVTDATTQITGADFGAFFYNTHDEQGEAFTLYTLSGASREHFNHLGMPRNTEIFQQTFTGEGVVRVDDITKDPRYGHNAPHFGMPKGHLPVVSYLAVPVVSLTGNVIGGLFFGHKEAGVFREDHEELVVNLASQAAISLDNSKLFEEVTELNRKKDEFIALASHELKTPMTSLSGFMQIAERIVTEPIPKDLVRRCITMLEKLNSLINDLFDISKIQSGKLQYHFEKVDLTALITEVVEDFKVSNLTHTIHVSKPSSAFVNADKMRLEQIIVNLLNNAVKYSPNTKKIDVRIENKTDHTIVIVKDYGIGISQEDQPHIFNQFFRVDGISHKISGLGLGLYITKEIIERHGGKITVESTPGEGSEFRFELPVK